MTITTRETELRDSAADPINYAKVAVLGAAGVGKTSIIRVSCRANIHWYMRPLDPYCHKSSSL